MSAGIIDRNTYETAQKAIADLNLRLQEIVLDEMRGRRVSTKLRRSLQEKRNKAHNMLRAAVGK